MPKQISRCLTTDLNTNKKSSKNNNAFFSTKYGTFIQLVGICHPDLIHIFSLERQKNLHKSFSTCMYLRNKENDSFTSSNSEVN